MDNYKLAYDKMSYQMPLMNVFFNLLMLVYLFLTC